MTTPSSVPVRELVLRALVVKHLADTAAVAYRTHKAALADELLNGDHINAADPDSSGVAIGQVYRTKPTGTAVITDRAALTAWMAERYPDRVHAIGSITDLDAVLAVLREHAPHLVETETVITDWAENEVVKLTEEARQPCGPGRELDVPGVVYQPPGLGTVTGKLAEDGPGVIARLWREGRIRMESGEILALPGAGGE